MDSSITNEGLLLLTVSPRIIFHSFNGTIGWRLLPRRWRGKRRGITLKPNGFQSLEGRGTLRTASLKLVAILKHYRESPGNESIAFVPMPLGDTRTTKSTAVCLGEHNVPSNQLENIGTQSNCNTRSDQHLKSCYIYLLRAMGQGCLLYLPISA